MKSDGSRRLVALHGLLSNPRYEVRNAQVVFEDCVQVLVRFDGICLVLDNAVCASSCLRVLFKITLQRRTQDISMI